MSPKRIPRATYRLQFNRDFTCSQGAAVAEYLNALGISDCYASPVFQAAAGSMHGYDVCDFSRFSDEAGGAAGFETLSARLRDFGLGLLLDMVPNHMAADTANEWWHDVLKHGPESLFASHFDINWAASQPNATGKILLPVLGDHYATVLEKGELKLVEETAGPAVGYYEKRFPLSESSLAALRKSDDFKLESLNGAPGNARSFDALHGLLQKQHYRLAFWRVGNEEINYRRFFDIISLVCLRVDLPRVFEDVHRLAFQLIRDGKVTGLRIDHPDGLWNPQTYFARLQQSFGDPQGQSLYVVAEKILSGDETLPADWPVAGTTGYDFLNQVNGLFVNSGNEAAFDEIYRDFTGNDLPFHTVGRLGKKNILEQSLVSEVNAVTRQLQRVAKATRYGQDFTFSRLRAAIIEISAALPVYRSYVREESAEVSAEDRERIQEALEEARRESCADTNAIEFIGNLLLLRLPRDLNKDDAAEARRFVMRFQQLSGPATAKGLEDTAFYNYNRLVSLNEVGGEPSQFGVSVKTFHAHNEIKAKHWPHSLLATATHDTKRGEDVRARVNVLSEMPSEWRDAVDRWREVNSPLRKSVSGNAAPDSNDEYLLYQTLVGAWPAAGDKNDLSVFRERIKNYMLKAIKEAKRNTTWTEPNVAYESAVAEFVAAILKDGSNPFLDDFVPFQKRVAYFGRFNSLAQVLLKATSPGVPDFYQGTELWDFSLVDPDNRRPVDFTLRQKILADLVARFGNQENETNLGISSDFVERDHQGESKLYTTWRALQFRSANSRLFEQGSYCPLAITGDRKAHACAFARCTNDASAITVVPRLIFGLTDGREMPPTGTRLWQETAVLLDESCRATEYRNVFTNEIVRVEKKAGERLLKVGPVLGNFPVALLTGI